MSHITLSFILLSILCISGTASTRRTQSLAYIEASCQHTLYRALCVQYLSSFSNATIQNPQQVAKAALYASLYRARDTRLYMLKVAKELDAAKAKEYRAVKDCLDQINDSVEQLSQSIRELSRLGCQEEEAGRGRGRGKSNVFWHISNVETWTSAALTDASLCADEFPGMRMSKWEATIKFKVLNVAQATSNALALFHRFAATYRSADATTNNP